MEFIDLKAQYQYLKEEMNQGLAQVLESARFIGGAEGSQLEKTLYLLWKWDGRPVACVYGDRSKRRGCCILPGYDVYCQYRASLPVGGDAHICRH